jgi:putative PIN family toxin of toxin-antitoxin system
MPAVIVDTNVLVSAALQEGAPRAAVRLAQRHYELAFTPSTFSELRAVLFRPAFDARISNRDRRKFLSGIRRAARLYRIDEAVPIARDPDDDVFLHLAVAADAVALVTGDRDLLVLGEFAGIPILSPTRFLRGERSIRRGRRKRRA